MLKYVVFLSLAAFGLSDVKVGFRATERLANDFPLYSLKVVGGQTAKEGEFQYQISLQTKTPRRHFCGGSIISEKVVLTAGHCIYPKYVTNPTTLQIVAGILRLSQTGSHLQAIGVEKIVKHPKYNGGVQPNDIAVLILESSLKFNAYVQPIVLPQKNAEYTGDTLLSGWGSTSYTEMPIYPDALQKVTLPIISHAECRAKWGPFSNLHQNANMCTGPVGGNISACSGDSGGPLVKEIDGKRILIGIVSWGSVPCGNGFPTVYTKVSYFTDFINQSMA